MLPKSERCVRLVAARGLDAVAAISSCGYRRPIAAVAGFRGPVHLQSPRADEVRAIATMDDRGGLIADRTGAEVPRLVATVDGEDGRGCAKAGARSGSSSVHSDRGGGTRREHTIARSEFEDVAAGRRKRRGGPLRGGGG